MNKVIRTVLFVIIAIVIVGLILYPKIKPEETGPELIARPGSSLLQVDVDIINPERIENTIKVTGAILANESVELRSEISGKLEKIYFQEGQRVRKRDLLITINDDEIVAQLERLKYTQKLNEDIEYRQRQLLEKEAISREEYEIALTTLNTTQSDIKEQEARLNKHKLVAPFDGIIGLRQVSEGSYITPNDLIGNIYSINPVKIEFSVPGKYSSEIHKGDSIIFTVENANDTFSGVVYAFEPRIDPRTRTMQIRGISYNEREILLPGQFARVSYVLEVIPNALMAPSESVIPELNGHKVYLFQGGKVVEKQVEIGLRTELEVQITAGINPGDTLITTGILQIRPGMPVALNQVTE